MAAKGRTPITRVLLGLVGMQILLPVVLSLTIMAIKGFQRRAIDGHNKASAMFVRFQLSDIAASISADREFCHNGMMFDIKSIEVENGKYVVYALPDEKENSLLKTKDQRGERVAGKVLPFVFLFHQHISAFRIAVYQRPPIYNDCYVRHATKTCMCVNSPPPRRDLVA